MKKIYSLLLLAGLFLLGAQNVMADYYVAHNGVLNNKSWNASGDLMTATGTANVWSCVFTNVTGAVEFKITVGNWDDPAYGAYYKDNEASDFALGGSGSDNISFSVTGKSVEIFWNSSTQKIWVKEFIPAVPTVYLTTTGGTNVLEGETITLTSNAINFSGTPVYAYSYSTDGGEHFTSMAGNTMTAGASGTAYVFKVIATYNVEIAEATVDVNVVVCNATGAFGDKFAGAADEVFGTAWDPADTENDMTYNAGDFTLAKNKIYLEAGHIYFKITLNHSWTTSYPSQNYDLEISEAGYYNLTFSFNWSAQEVSAEAVKINVADGYYLIGKINGVEDWNLLDLTPAQKFEPNLGGDEGEWFVTSALAEDDHFKVVKVVDYDIQTWYPDEGGDYFIEADHAGALKHIYFKPDGEDHPLAHDGWYYGKIYVQPNPIQLNLVAGWNTVCLPYAAEIANVDGYAIQSIDLNGGSVSLIPMNGVLEPATAYLINAAAGGSHEATLMGGKVTDQDAEAIFRGNLSETPVVLYATDENYGYFVLSGNEFHQLTGDATATVNQYKAYIRMAKNDIPSTAPALRIINGATGIENIEGNETAVKFIENGKVLILREGVVYDMTGRVVR